MNAAWTAVRTARAGTGTRTVPRARARASASISGSAARLNGPGTRRSSIRTTASATSSAWTNDAATWGAAAAAVGPPARQEAGGAVDQRPEEVATDLAAGVRLQHQGRTDDADRHVGCPTVTSPDHPLGLGLVAAVLRAGDAGRRPVLGDALADRAGGVGADRRHVHDVAHPGDPGGAHDPAGALDVDPAQVLRLPAGLQRPGQVHDRVHAVHELRQRRLAARAAEVGQVPPHAGVRRDVGRLPAGQPAHLGGAGSGAVRRRSSAVPRLPLAPVTATVRPRRWPLVNSGMPTPLPGGRRATGRRTWTDDPRRARDPLQHRRRRRSGVPPGPARPAGRGRRRRLADPPAAARRGRGAPGRHLRRHRAVPGVRRHRGDRRRPGERGVAVDGPVTDQGWGRLATVPLPGGGRIGVYEARHPTAFDR